MEHVDNRELNEFLRNTKNLKVYLEKTKKIVLPPSLKKNDGVSRKWLLRVAKDEVFTVSEEKFRHYEGTLKRPVSRHDLNTYIIQVSGMPTGFAELSLPDKGYLIDCLYSIKPDHEVFETIDDSLAMLVPECLMSGGEQLVAQNKPSNSQKPEKKRKRGDSARLIAHMQNMKAKKNKREAQLAETRLRSIQERLEKEQAVLRLLEDAHKAGEEIQVMEMPTASFETTKKKILLKID